MIKLRLELFVDGLQKSASFYNQVLGFQICQGGTDGYTMLANDAATISLNLRDYCRTIILCNVDRVRTLAEA